MSVENYGSYRFRYVKDGGSSGKIKVYVERQPSYQGRCTNSGIIHRYPGRNGSPPCICFKEKFKPRSLGQAKSLARKWANMTNRYIRSGITISSQIK